MSDPYLGEIQAFPFSWAVGNAFNRAWMPCLGQLLPITQNTALYSLIGTLYGGNGTTNFGLPNLNGNITNGQGNGPGLQPRVIGQSMGTSTVVLNVAQMAAHSHGLQLGNNSASGAAAGPGTGLNMAALDPKFNGFVAPPTTTGFAGNGVGFTGQNQPHDNMQPYQAITWCICYAGIFPTFNATS